MYVPRAYGLVRVPRGVGQLQAIASEIQTIEGWFPGSMSYRNNNPGNLMAAGQPGCTATTGGFCDFDSYADGYQALLNQIQLDASRGMTIQQFAESYAPASDGNDPTSYAASLASAVGLSTSDSLSDAIQQAASSVGSSVASTTISLGLPDLSDIGSDLSSFLGSDDSGGLDLSAYGLGVVSPLVLTMAAVALAVIVFL